MSPKWLPGDVTKFGLVPFAEVSWTGTQSDHELGEPNEAGETRRNRYFVLIIYIQVPRPQIGKFLMRDGRDLADDHCGFS